MTEPNFGRDAYLTSLARAYLAIAYRRRASGNDLAAAAGLSREEVAVRARRYGPEHPFTLVARAMLADCLLDQAEAADDQQERQAFARHAYAEASSARIGRDQIFGATSSSATRCRRQQAHALLLLGEPADLRRAHACLRYALAFDTARNDNAEWRGSGPTHLLMARACLALGDRQAAHHHAKNAHRLLTTDAPAGPLLRTAAAMLRQLQGEHAP